MTVAAGDRRCDRRRAARRPRDFAILRPRPRSPRIPFARRRSRRAVFRSSSPATAGSTRREEVPPVPQRCCARSPTPTTACCDRIRTCSAIAAVRRRCRWIWRASAHAARHHRNRASSQWRRIATARALRRARRATRRALRRIVAAARSSRAGHAPADCRKCCTRSSHESGCSGQLAALRDARGGRAGAERLTAVHDRASGSAACSSTTAWSAFIQHLDLADRSRATTRPPPRSTADDDAVHVLTAHNAKGLEFPVVFMVSLVERHASRPRAQPTRCRCPTELVVARPESTATLLARRSAGCSTSA